ncbi:hypothetical protein FDA77_00820 [Clostridium botulinum]|nr:hypothetical protein [Clostridium botulinum]NFJ88491.1 hypothetical protein [Clostridium botulinum]HDI3121693.1 siphovirus ReqiPepy6 Gp37-like family protein [Clostridium botulinum]
METTIKVFDEKLNYLTEICCFNSLYFKTSYSEATEFMFYVNSTLENFANIKKGNIIKVGENEGIILNRKTAKQNNIEMIQVKGLTLNCILNRRRLLEERTFWNMRIDKIIRILMEENITNAKDINRNITNLEIINTDLDLPVVPYFKATTSKNLAENIFELCKLYEIGNKIELDLNNKKFLFKLYKGNNLNNICFSYETNVLDMEYEESDINMKNLCYIKLDDKNNYKVIGETKGLNRHETIVENKKVDTDEIIKSFEEIGNKTLFKNKTKENIKCVISPNRFYIFNRDYKLGDIITVKNKNWNFQKELRIEEIEETYDKEYTLNITLGEQVPLIFTKIKSKITNLEDKL